MFYLLIMLSARIFVIYVLYEKASFQIFINYVPHKDYIYTGVVPTAVYTIIGKSDRSSHIVNMFSNIRVLPWPLRRLKISALILKLKILFQ